MGSIVIRYVFSHWLALLVGNQIFHEGSSGSNSEEVAASVLVMHNVSMSCIHLGQQQDLSDETRYTRIKKHKKYNKM